MDKANRDIKEIIEKLVARMTEIDDSDFEEECPISIVDINKWEWAQGGGLYGIY